MAQKDNSTIALKVKLRKLLLAEIDAPVVLETHGGAGEIWRYCYSRLSRGYAIEMDQAKAGRYVQRAPAWGVYQGNSLGLLASGIVAQVEANVIDMDPYGSPWDFIDALFEAKCPDEFGLAVNDGLRQKLRLGGGWDVKAMESVVLRYGNAEMFGNYLEICRELLEEKAADRGYSVRRWSGWYCGAGQNMTHYAAVFSR